tara:strand:+ start:3312 stop:3488 length:177 start_codon:yes stop_codon:yes gene_type:complete
VKKLNMNIGDIRVYALNLAAVGVSQFSGIEEILKIILLLLSIGYTISKWKNNSDETKK